MVTAHRPGPQDDPFEAVARAATLKQLKAALVPLLRRGHGG